MRLAHRDGAVTVQAPAKVNLFLKILGKRSDGFHEIETLMATLSLHDTLVLRPTEDDQVSFRCRHCRPRQTSSADRFTIPEDSSNLVVRAATLLKERAGVRHGADITLYKRIPAAAGLAGGSSDAAAALAGLNRLWSLQLSRQELTDVAGMLGSDVPFFFAESAAAICRGRGEKIAPVRIPKALNFVILRPETGLSTAEVYSRCRPSPISHDAEQVIAALSTGNSGRTAYVLHNGLQDAAEQLNTDVTAALCVLRNRGVSACQMSGSGTAVFGLCQTWGQARRTASRLAGQRIGEVFAAQCRP